jgi:hypothetical protein
VLILLNLVVAGHEPVGTAVATGGPPPRPVQTSAQPYQQQQPYQASRQYNEPPNAHVAASGYSNPYEPQRGIAEPKGRSPYDARPSPYDHKPQSSSGSWAPNNKPIARHDDSREAITPINALNPYSNR